jgi:hypothetical protein
VDGKQLPPFLELELDQRRDDLDAGVADQDVDAPEGFDSPRHSALDLLLVSDVHANPERALGGRIDLKGRLLGRLRVKIRDDHLCSLTGEGKRNLLPMPLAAPVITTTIRSRPPAFPARLFDRA